MSFQSPLSRRSRGFTLTEAAIVLGIVGLILSAIWVAAASVYNNYRVGKTSEQLLTIVQSMRSMHASQLTVDTGFAGEAGAIILAQAGGVPSDMIEYQADGTTVNSVRDVWGGAISINAQADNNGLANGAFAVTFTNVPQSACISLITRNTGAGRDTGLIGAGNAAQTGTPFPISATTAVADCPATGTAGNTLVFTFRLKA